MKPIFLFFSCLSMLSCTVAGTAVLNNDGNAITSEEIAVSTQATESEDGSLWVRISEPLDGATIRSPAVVVKGESSPETVLSINDDILFVQDGIFDVSIPLEMGDNLLEIVASDIQGNEITLYLLVTRE